MNQAKVPEWATPGLNRIIYGKAKANGADELTLSDFDATTGFLEVKSGELHRIKFFNHCFGC
jgi:hypothetical protein